MPTAFSGPRATQNHRCRGGITASVLPPRCYDIFFFSCPLFFSGVLLNHQWQFSARSPVTCAVHWCRVFVCVCDYGTHSSVWVCNFNRPSCRHLAAAHRAAKCVALVWYCVNNRTKNSRHICTTRARARRAIILIGDRWQPTGSYLVVYAKWRVIFQHAFELVQALVHAPNQTDVLMCTCVRR